MSELIVQMELPKHCFECFFRLDCEIYMNEVMKPFEKRDFTAFKPLVNGCLIHGVLPEEHGDLVDYNEVKQEFDRLLTYIEEVQDENGIIWFRRETIVPRGYEMKFHIIVPAERSEA